MGEPPSVLKACASGRQLVADTSTECASAPADVDDAIDLAAVYKALT